MRSPREVALLGGILLFLFRPVAGQIAPEPALPELVVGGVEDRGGRPLYQVRGAALLEDGRLVVAEQSEALLYDARGGFERVLARKGEGPGEVGAVAGISTHRSDGGLWIWDSLLRRTTRIDLSGRVLEERRTDASPVGTSLPLGDGSVLAVASRRLRRRWDTHDWPRPREGTRTVFDTLDVIRWNVDGSVDVLLSVEDGLRLEVTGGQYTSSRHVPWAGRPLVAIGSAGVAVAYSDSSVARVFDVLENGGAVRSLTVAQDRVRASAAYVDSLRRQFLGGSAEVPFDGLASAGDASWRKALAAVPESGWRQMFDAVHLDREGRVWLRSAQGPEWVIAGRGLPLERCILPGSARILDVRGDRVVVLTRDDMDVESVGVYRFGGPD